MAPPDEQRPHELALRVLMPSFGGTALPDDWVQLLEEGLGSICLFGSNTADGLESVRALTAAIHAVRPATVICTDEEGGDVTRLYAMQGSPVLGAAALGAAGDLELTRATGRAVAADLASVGITLDLGPIADVNSNPDNPVIGTRSFSSSADDAAQHVAAWVSGLQEGGVDACVKHFPGHGDTGEDSHLALPVLDLPLDVMRTRELVPFIAAVKAGVAAVMTSHIVVPALDPELPGTLSAPVLSLLRDELGFEGVIVSDALDMAGASASRGIPAAAVLSLAAGADLLCIGPDKPVSLVREIQHAILDALADGRLSLDALERSAERIARLSSRSTQADLPLSEREVDDAQVAGAQAALTVSGDLPSLAGALVVSVGTPANIAVGEVPWGLEPDVVVAPTDDLPDGPLILQVRDAHRRPEVLELLARAEAGGPVVVVEWGWPGPYVGAAPRICTRGYSRPGAVAVTELLRTAGWVR